MDKINLSNYINALESTLNNAKDMLVGELNVEQLFKDIDRCNKDANLILSLDDLHYGTRSERVEDFPSIVTVRKVKCGYKFVLDRLLPHRLDYHNIGFSRAKKINHFYADNFQKGVFEYLASHKCKKIEGKAFLIFINYYNPAEKLTWDNDNLDVKVFIDYAISGKFISDDSHEDLSYMMLSKCGEITHTEVVLCKECDLVQILKQIME